MDVLHTDTSNLDQLVNLKDFTVANVVNCLIWRSEHEELYVRWWNSCPCPSNSLFLRFKPSKTIANIQIYVLRIITHHLDPIRIVYFGNKSIPTC
jgi:hypothetical protein